MAPMNSSNRQPTKNDLRGHFRKYENLNLTPLDLKNETSKRRGNAEKTQPQTAQIALVSPPRTQGAPKWVQEPPRTDKWCPHSSSQSDANNNKKHPETSPKTQEKYTKANEKENLNRRKIHPQTTHTSRNKTRCPHCDVSKRRIHPQTTHTSRNKIFIFIIYIEDISLLQMDCSYKWTALTNGPTHKWITSQGLPWKAMNYGNDNSQVHNNQWQFAIMSSECILPEPQPQPQPQPRKIVVVVEQALYIVGVADVNFWIWYLCRSNLDWGLRGHWLR